MDLTGTARIYRTLRDPETGTRALSHGLVGGSGRQLWSAAVGMTPDLIGPVGRHNVTVLTMSSPGHDRKGSGSATTYCGSRSVWRRPPLPLRARRRSLSTVTHDYAWLSSMIPTMLAAYTATELPGSAEPP